jgi:hypothetical protein
MRVEVEYDVLFTVPIDEGPSASNVPHSGVRKNDEPVVIERTKLVKK